MVLVMDSFIRPHPWLLLPDVLESCSRTAVEVAAGRRSMPFPEATASEREKKLIEYLGIGDPDPEDFGEGIRVVHLSGTMMLRPSIEERYFYGARDITAVGRHLAEAERDDGVTGVILAVDSPGGQVTGTPELAARMKSFRKPLAVFTDSVMASGAYYVASQAHMVYATASAQVGSIGVYLAIYDISGMMDQCGVKVDLIKSGAYKAAGFPGTSLTDEQRALLQDSVSSIHAEFKRAVKARRTGVSDADMEGQVFDGKSAAGKGLVTGLAPSLPVVAAKLKKLI